MEGQTFGGFLKQKRMRKEITLRRFAEMVGFSPVYLCDIEKDRKPAPSDERLKQIIYLLALDKQEIDELYDLAAMSRSRPAVSNDLPEYIMTNQLARVALRTAKDTDATDAEWLEFIERLNGRVVSDDAHKGKRIREDSG